MKLIEKYNYLCALCLERQATSIHEIIPKSQGGKLTEDNQIPLCTLCHNVVQSREREYRIVLYQAQARALLLFGNDIQVGGNHA